MTSMRRLIALATPLAAVSAGAQAPMSPMSPAAMAPAAPAPMSKTSDLFGPGGKNLGKITVTEAPHGVILRIQATNLPTGWHAVHFHEKGVCSDEGFKMSGGHIHSATPAVHGLLNPAATDSGDLPNVFVAGGTVVADLYSTLVSMNGAGGRPALADADGSAVVIHASADDYMTQPIGGAGARIACAVIK